MKVEPMNQLVVGDPEMGHYGVSVITPTIRFEQLSNILNNFKNQTLLNKELIIILNNEELELETYVEQFMDQKDITVYQLPKTVTLGECLNFGVTFAKYNYIAKFDDDDIYTEGYLIDAMIELLENDADVVGKQSYFVYLEKYKKLIRTKGQQRTFYKNFDRTLKGSTLIFRKGIFPKVRFTKINLGEDVLFLRSCIAHSHKIYIGDDRNHLVLRNEEKYGHTWKRNDDQMIQGADLIMEDISLDEAIELVK